MNIKKSIALLSAVIMLGMTLTACGGKDDDAGDDAEISVITDGTEPQGEGDSTAATSFEDPAAQLGIDVSQVTDAEGNAVTEAATEATLPDNHDEIVQMIQDAQNGADTTSTVQIMTEYNIDYTDRYAYNQLSDAEKELYVKILNAANSLKLKVEVDDTVTTEMWTRAYGCVCMQEPELFWISSARVKVGHVYYWETDESIIAERQAQIDETVSSILSAVNGMTEYETLKYFHDYIVLNNTFSLVDVIDEGAEKQTIYGALVTGSIQCEGYAKAMMYLCDMAGIECVVVTGTNESNETHAWNCVKLDGNWYNVDTTWDDPILSVEDKTNLRYNYFLVPDSWIHSISHFNVNQKIGGTELTYFTPPTCTSEEYNYFNVEGKLYDNVDDADAAIKAAMKESAENKVRVAEIRVTSQEIYDEITANLSEYANWIKSENSSVTKVTSNCDANLLIIELGLVY